MSATKAPQYRGHVRCPLCQRLTSVKPSGRMYPHGPQRSCPGATNYIVRSDDSSDAREVVSALRRLWFIGDALAAANLTGVPYLAPAVPDGLDADQWVQLLVADGRKFIADVARRIGVESVAA